MKDALLHLSLYILCALGCAIAILLVLLVMGASWGAIGFFIGPVLLSAWALGMVPATLRLLRRARRPVMTAMLVACLTAGVVSASIVLHGTSRISPAGSPIARSMSEGTVETGRIYQGREYSVMVDQVNGNELGPVIVVDHTEGIDARMNVHSQGYWDHVRNELILPGDSDIALDDLRGFGVPVMPATVRSTVSDVLGLVESATLLWSAPLPFFDSARIPPIFRTLVSPMLSVLVLTLLIIAVWTPLRLTRWPLLNVVVGLAYLRVVAALPTAVDQLMQVEFVARRTPGVSWSEFLLVGGVATFLIIAVVSLLLPSVAQWRHHMHFQERRS